MNSTLPMSNPIGIYEARTHLSQIFDDLVNGRCGPVPITRRGTKTAYLVLEPPMVESRHRKSIIGCMEGRFRHLTREDIKLTPEEIDEHFGEKRFAAKKARISR